MTPSLRRRRLLAAAVPGLLAGCLVESSEDAGERDGNGAEASAGDAESGSGSDAESDADRESLSGGEASGDEQTDDGRPGEVGPDGAGLAVTNVDVLSVTDGGYETTVEARITVENAGRFTYGTIELRADAYASRPSSNEREAVGYAYETQEYSSDDRFVDGTRQFTVEVSFRSRRTRARPDPDWYEVDAAVRRAEPV